MMGDSNHLVMLKTDFNNKDSFKGVLIFKCSYRSVLGADVDPKDKKLLTVELKKDTFDHRSELRQSTIVTNSTG